MPRKSLSEEIEQRRQVEYFLNEGVLSIYAIARKVGVSETTVRKYRRDLAPKQAEYREKLADLARTVPKASTIPAPPVPVLMPSSAPKPTGTFALYDLVFCRSIRCTVTQVHVDGTYTVHGERSTHEFKNVAADELQLIRRT